MIETIKEHWKITLAACCFMIGCITLIACSFEADLIDVTKPDGTQIKIENVKSQAEIVENQVEVVE